METAKIIKIGRELFRPFCITKGKEFRLKDVDPNNTREFGKGGDKPRAKDALAMGVMALSDLQEKLCAQDKWAVILISQAMDATGKDGAIKHVMFGVNPQRGYFSPKLSSGGDATDKLYGRRQCLEPTAGNFKLRKESLW